MQSRIGMLIGLSGFIGVAAACAVSDADPPLEPNPVDDAGMPPATPPDAGGSDARDASDAEATAPLPCSDAGWCATSVPDPAIRFLKLAAFEKKAFALAWVGGRTTPLVFDGSAWTAIANDRWVMTPKNEQSLFALAAPNEHEMWIGGADGYLARGVDTSGTWVWTVFDLATRDTVRSIYPLGGGELFVATDSRVFRKGAGDSGDAATAWSVELEAKPLEGEAFPGREFPAGTVPLPPSFRALVGTASNDLWVLGAKASCVYLAHRTDAGWRMLLDALGARNPVNGASYCQESYTPSVSFREGALGAPVLLAPGQIAFIYGETQEAVQEEEDYLSVLWWARVPPGTLAFWKAPESDVAYSAGYAAVLKNADWIAGGDWQVSTISLDGKNPTLKSFRAIAGVSEKNMWVAGDSYALHRTLL